MGVEEDNNDNDGHDAGSGVEKEQEGMTQSARCSNRNSRIIRSIHPHHPRCSQRSSAVLCRIRARTRRNGSLGRWSWRNESWIGFIRIEIVRVVILWVFWFRGVLIGCMTNVAGCYDRVLSCSDSYSTPQVFFDITSTVATFPLPATAPAALQL